MKKLNDLKTPINQIANSLRLTGVFLMTAGAVGLVADSANTQDGWDFFKQVMLHLMVAGFILTFTGERLWKILLRNSDVTERKFYFYNED